MIMSTRPAASGHQRPEHPVSDLLTDLHFADPGAVEDALWARALPLVGGTREDVERRVREAIGTRPADLDGLRRVAALFGLAVTSSPDAAR